MKKYYERFILFNAILIIIIAISFLLFSVEINILINSWVGNLLFLFSIVSFKSIYGTYINQFNIFNFTYFLFSFGQLFLKSLGLQYKRFDLIKINEPQLIFKYLLFYNFTYIILFLTQLTSAKKEMNNLDVEENSDDNYYKQLKIIYFFFFLLTMPYYIFSLIQKLIISTQSGYLSIYEARQLTGLTRLFDSINFLFIPSLIALLYFNKNSKIKSWLITLSLSTIMLVLFIIGNRGEAIGIFLSIIYLWHTCIKPFEGRNLIKLIIVLIVIVSILPSIQVFRETNMKSVNTFIDIISDGLKNNNPLIEIVGELGGSMNPWLLTYRIIPSSQNFRLGFSYVSSFLAVFPSIIFFGYSFAEHALLAGWLQETLNLSYGPGYSILAELYYNFGWFGIPIMFIVGKFYSNMLVTNPKYSNQYSNRYLFISIVVYILSRAARNSLYLTIRVYFFVIIVPKLFAYIFSKKVRSNYV